jgi:hypothetical protein
MRQHQATLGGDPGPRGHPVDDQLPAALRRIARRDEEREHAHDAHAEPGRDIAGAAEPVELGSTGCLHADLADGRADGGDPHPGTVQLGPGPA